MTDNEVVPAEELQRFGPPEVPAADRLSRLTGYFRDIADHLDSLQPQTIAYVRGGGSLRLCLNEIVALSEPQEQDQAIDTARTSYMSTLLKKPMITRRNGYTQVCAERETQYVDSVVAKIQAVVDSSGADNALVLGQMPTLLERISFKDGEQMSLEDLAANHLYLLVDTALKEHVRRRELIDTYRDRSVTARILGNHALHLAVAGGIFAASFIPKLGVLPGSSNLITDDVDLGLRIMSGTIFGLDAPEALRLQYLDSKHNKRTRELHEQLAEHRELTDQALRMVYSSTRYGGSKLFDQVTGRSGTDDKEENLRRFERLDQEFPHLNNDPGGKPYTANQAVGYAARLLIERKGQLNEIIDPQKSVAEKEHLFITLARQILVEDVTRMKKGLTVSHFRRRLMNLLAVVPVALLPSTVAAINDASSLGRDTVGALTSASGQKTTEEDDG